MRTWRSVNRHVPSRRPSGVDAGELHVGTLYSISVGVLPQALGKWRHNYPDVQVRLVEFRRTQDLIAAMEAGQADVAVGPTPREWNGPVEAIGVEEFVIAASPDAVLPSNGGRVKLADLAHEHWVKFTSPSGLSDILEDACQAAGFEPHAAVRTEQAPSALALALEGLGLTLVPGNVVPAEFPGRLLWPDPPVRRELSVYTRVEPDPITAAFVAAITRNTLATPPHLLQRVGNPV
jgi:DNA-binding transcriptional LysR family regulator